MPGNEAETELNFSASTTKNVNKTAFSVFLRSFFFFWDVNQLDKSGRTALHNAILGGHVNIVEILLEAGADTTLLDRSQEAPLHTAVRTGNENLVKVRITGILRSF